MFEELSRSNIDIGGTGGEYTGQVRFFSFSQLSSLPYFTFLPPPHAITHLCTQQVGFGWMNGVVLWAASNFGNVLVAPSCPDPLAELAGVSSNWSSTTSAVSGSLTTRASATYVLGVDIVGSGRFD